MLMVLGCAGGRPLDSPEPRGERAQSKRSRVTDALRRRDYLIDHSSKNTTAAGDMRYEMA